MTSVESVSRRRRKATNKTHLLCRIFFQRPENETLFFIEKQCPARRKALYVTCLHVPSILCSPGLPRRQALVH